MGETVGADHYCNYCNSTEFTEFNSVLRLTRAHKDRHSENVWPPICFHHHCLFIASLRLRKYKPAEQADSKSIIQQPESDHEIQGEVGVIYGASAKPALSA